MFKKQFVKKAMEIEGISGENIVTSNKYFFEFWILQLLNN